MSKTLHQQIGIKKSVTDMIQKQPSIVHQINNFENPKNNEKKNYIKNTQNKQKIIQKQEGFKVQVNSKQNLQNQQINNEQNKINFGDKNVIQNDQSQDLFYIFFKTKDIDSEGQGQLSKQFQEISKMIDEKSDIKFSQIQQIKQQLNKQTVIVDSQMQKSQIYKDFSTVNFFLKLQKKIFFSNRFQAINLMELNKFLQFMQNFENIEEFKLDFRHNKSLQKNVIELSQSIMKCSFLQKIQLKLNNCCLSKQEIENLFNGLENFQNLRILSADLRYNNYDQQSLLMMLTDISKCPNIQNLEILNNLLDIDDYNLLQYGLLIKKLTKLQMLSLGFVDCGLQQSLNIEILVQSISDCAHLKDLTLDLYGNNIQDFKQLGEALEMCKNLQSLTLDITRCYIDFSVSLNQLQKSILKLKKIRFLAFFLIEQLELADIRYYYLMQKFKSKLPRLVEYQHDSLENIDFEYKNNNVY
ncbi:hypothetical protein ABPG74_015570 [Tetrahymena malaccensis]